MHLSADNDLNLSLNNFTENLAANGGKNFFNIIF